MDWYKNIFFISFLFLINVDGQFKFNCEDKWKLFFGFIVYFFLLLFLVIIIEMMISIAEVIFICNL